MKSLLLMIFCSVFMGHVSINPASKQVHKATCKYYYLQIHYWDNHHYASFSSVFQCDKKPFSGDYSSPTKLPKFPEVVGPFETYWQAENSRKESLSEAKQEGHNILSGLEHTASKSGSRELDCHCE